jgi:hypothetical protein
MKRLPNKEEDAKVGKRSVNVREADMKMKKKKMVHKVNQDLRLQHIKYEN